jgi:transposase
MPQRPFSRDEPWGLPASIEELVPADHPIRFVACFVESLPPAAWAALGIKEAAPRGAPRYAPEVLLLIWLAGFVQGTRTTRKLASACQFDLTFRWLTGGQPPDHNTLWRFYAAHREAMRTLLRQSVLTAIQAGLADLAEQAVDGTKVLAQAAKERSLTVAEWQQVQERIDEALAHLESQHTGDDEPPPPNLPEELANQQALQERITAALAQVGEAEPTTRIALSDPEARMMKTRTGVRPGYNAQAVTVALDAAQAGGTGRLILATAVTAAADDHAQLAPMIAAAQLPGRPAPLTLADGGYHSGAMLAACAQAGYRVVMPEAQSAAQRGDPYHKDQFAYEPEPEVYRCPEGQPLTRRGSYQRKDGRTMTTYRAEAGVCADCVVKPACTKTKRQGRSLQIGAYEAALRAHRQWMTTDEAQQASRRRGPLIEAVFGTLKEQWGGRRFLLRGLDKVTAEWALLALGANLRTLARVWAANAAFRTALEGGKAAAAS